MDILKYNRDPIKKQFKSFGGRSSDISNLSDERTKSLLSQNSSFLDHIAVRAKHLSQLPIPKPKMNFSAVLSSRPVTELSEKEEKPKTERVKIMKLGVVVESGVQKSAK